MPKTNINDILKPGVKLIAKKIDFDDPEVKQMLKAVHEEQEKSLKRKYINWDRLDRTYVNL